ncbi:hypothetical protein DACRYDRAFT_119917 [Dacryopinax primogenitus]|uniref:F-box domain-containing protein n=1 Tax=Dacryopinax primogenitus (strain DJM 731) TaxID=1858805 RepID=M5FN24_DACPD|nr:uncharacterized protein DACRYDRAFT_119917 [Dacryopinax primogenitus]EJT96700.1 hypothetical protein DACRYDRAFT_119917 [Dacryopinax primogenitus]
MARGVKRSRAQVESAEEPTLAKSKKRSHTLNHALTDDAGDPVSGKSAGVVNPQKAKKVRGRRGQLAFILQAPTEIVLQIMSHLWPLDILNLSYADKELRSMLTAPNNKFIWEAARANVPGLPELPPDFTEWGYARLLWFNECDMCGSRLTRKPEFALLRIRLCPKCSKKHVINGFHLHWPRDIIKPFGDHTALLPNFVGDFFEPALKRLARRVQKIKGTPRWEVWEKQRRTFIEKVQEHGKALSEWIVETNLAAKEKSIQMQMRRREAISERLIGLGHSPEDVASILMQKQRLICSSEEVTEKNWPRIQKILEGVLRNIKEERIKATREDEIRDSLKRVYCEYWASLPPGKDKHTMPPVLDFLDLPSSLRLLYRHDASGVDMKASFSNSIAQIEQDIELFRSVLRRDLFLMYDTYERQQSFAAWAKDDTNKNDFTRYRFLRRATTVFVFSQGRVGTPVHYDSLFSHAFEPDHTRGQTPNLLAKWDDLKQMLRVDTHAIEIMERIVKRAKLNPATTTIDDLESLGAGFSRPNIDKHDHPITWRELVCPSAIDVIRADLLLAKYHELMTLQCSWVISADP